MENLRVVIVEDEPAQRIVLRGLVEEAGYEVAGEGASGIEALELCSRLKPDILILDVNMPEKDGISAATDIGKVVPTPIVLLTACDDALTVKRAVNAGVMAYLVKPIRAEELMPALELAISRFKEFEELKDENQGLKDSIETRKLVERAKGLLMERDGLSEDDAFVKLRKLSMDRRKPMRDIAETVIYLMKG